MTRIIHRTFDGIIPRLEPALLPENAAQTAQDVDLRRGVLSPVMGRGIQTQHKATAIAVGDTVLTCGAAGSSSYSAWKAIVNPEFRVAVSTGFPDVPAVTPSYAVCSPVFSAVKDMDEVAEALEDALLDDAGIEGTVAWDAVGGLFTFTVRKPDFAIIEYAHTGHTDLSAAGWLNSRSAVSVPVGVNTIHLWRYTTHGTTEGGVTFGYVGQLDWTQWAALENGSGFSIRLADTTYQVRPDFAPEATTENEIAESITYALRMATGNMALRFVFGTPAEDPSKRQAVFMTPGLKLLRIGAPDDTSLEDLSAAGWLAATVTAAVEVGSTDMETWIGWPGRVNVVPSPINDDYYGRIYYTGDGAPRMRYTLDGVTHEVELPIEAPATAPTVTGTDVSEPEDPGALTTRPPTDTFTLYTWGVLILVNGKEKARVYVPGTVTIGLASDTIRLQKKTELVTNLPRNAEVTYQPFVFINETTVADVYENPLLNLGWNAQVYGVEGGGAAFSVTIEEVPNLPRQRTVTVEGTIRVRYSLADDEGTEGTPEAPVEEAVYPSYCCAFVTELGEEGPLSPASYARALLADDPVYLDDIPQPVGAAARGITHIRLYRSAGGVFRWLQDIEIGVTAPPGGHEFVDGAPGDDTRLGEEAPDYGVNPPDDLEGLIGTPNGWFAGFHGREVCLSEPWLPYAWPTGYRLTVPDEVVALAAVGNDVVVLTTGRPVILSGTDPATVAAAVLEVDQACVSAGSVALLGNMVVYASPDGLVGVYAGQAQMLTREFYRRADWQALTPTLISAAVHDGRYIASFGDRLLLFDIGTEAADRLTTATGTFGALYSDLETDTLYVVDRNAVLEWGLGDTELQLVWRGKEWRYGQPVSFGALRVVAESYPVPGIGDTDQRPLVTLYADGSSVATHRVTDGTVVRLPRLRPARRWSVQVSSYVEVREIVVATSPRGVLA